MAAGSAESVEVIEKEGAGQAIKDLFAGAVGGVAQVLIGEYIFRLSSRVSKIHVILSKTIIFPQ